MSFSPPCGNEDRFDGEAVARAIERRGLLLVRIELGEGSLDDPLPRDVIAQSADLGAQKIVFQGKADPCEELFELIRIARDSGDTGHRSVGVGLITTGEGIDEEAARFFAAHEVEITLDAGGRGETIRSLLDAAPEAEPDAENEGGTVRQALDRLANAGYPAPERPLTLAVAVCRGTEPLLPELWRRLRERGIRPCFETHRTPTVATGCDGAAGNAALDRAVGDNPAGDDGAAALPPERAEALFLQLARIDREEHGIEWTPRPPLAGGACHCVPVSCLVDPTGDVFPCAGVGIAVGNVRERPLAEILKESEVLQDFRDYGKRLKGPCRVCPLTAECYGCRGTAYRDTGDFTASDPRCWKNGESLESIERLPIAAERVVPQRKPMLLIDRLLAVGERRARAGLTVPEAGPYVDSDGRLERLAFPELAAQTIAAMDGFRNLESEESHEGMLLGIKNFEILGDAHAGDALTVSVFKAEKFGQFGIIEGEVARDGEILAKGEIKVWNNR